MAVTIAGSGTVTGVDPDSFETGLRHIVTKDFSAVSSVSVDGCFTSEFDNYRVLATITTTSAGMNILGRLRASGTDSSAADYSRNLILLSNGSVSGNRATGQSSWELVNIGSGQRSTMDATVFAPNLAAKTSMRQSFGPNVDSPGTQTRYGLNGFDHSLTSAYDGITLLTSTGTITGTVSIYGHKS